MLYKPLNDGRIDVDSARKPLLERQAQGPGLGEEVLDSLHCNRIKLN